MTVVGTNFGKAASDYGTFRAGFPDSLFDRLAQLGIGTSKQSIVDLGTGTGTFARGFAIRGCSVIGVDPDARMIAQSKLLDRQQHVRIDYVEAVAESSGLGSNSADVVAAGQSWHWFDRKRAISEAFRILRSGGKLVIAHFDWLPLPGNIVEATETLIERFNSAWHMGGGTGMYPQWIPDLGDAGMQRIETFSYDVEVPYTHEAWRGRIRASAGIAALDAEAVDEFDGALAELLATRFPPSPLAIPHRVSAIVSVKP